MALGDQISCGAFANFLVSQEPVYDQEILADIRPAAAGLVGFYQSGSFDAYSAGTHTFDRFNSVFPNLTNAWKSVDGTNCAVPSPCDVPANKIGMGYTRTTYGLQTQAWDSEIVCFDQIMLKTRAKEHYQQFMSGILRPASLHIMNDFLMKEAIRLASKVFAVTGTGTNGQVTDITVAWEGTTAGSEGYVYLNTSADPTGKLTAPVLQNRVDQQIMVGGAEMGADKITGLRLHTDKDTFYDMVQGNPELNTKYRIMTGQFQLSSKEYYEYGLRGYVGDFMVQVLQFPLRFNKVQAGRYQYVQPYINVPATEGIKSIVNPDWINAQYQFSLINNPRALRVLAFRPQAVSSQMPFMVRDYGGQWRFVTNDLGSDCNGRAIDNSRGNKGKFIADFRLAIKPERPEWLEAIFHLRNTPCIEIETPCKADPGYPAQSYASVNTACPSVFSFAASVNGSNVYSIAANSVTCNGNPVTHIAISNASLATVVTSLNTLLGGLGVWSVYNSNTVRLTGSTCEDVNLPFSVA